MKACLLDTSAALIALAEPGRLSRRLRAAMLAGPNFLSVVSYWEVMLKSMKGTLRVGDPRAWWPDALEQLAATPLALRAEHVAALHDLPMIHRDPFDRILMAQAMVEEFSFVTLDAEVQKHASKHLRVIQ